MFFRYLRRSQAPVILLPVILAIGFAAWAGFYTAHLARVTRELYLGQGTVLAIHPPDDEDSPEIVFRFQDRSGASHERTEAVSRSTWRQYTQGRPLELYVSAIDSSEAWPRREGDPSEWGGVMLFVGSLALILIGVLAMLGVTRRASLRARALERGIRFPGRVRSVLEGTGRSRGEWMVIYSWAVNGREYQSNSPTLRQDEAERYHVEDEVPVFVDPRDESNGEVDFFGLRAEAEQLRNAS